MWSPYWDGVFLFFGLLSTGTALLIRRVPGVSLPAAMLGAFMLGYVLHGF